MLKLGAIDTYFFCVYISMQLHQKINETSDSAFVNVTDTNFFLQITASHKLKLLSILQSGLSK